MSSRWSLLLCVAIMGCSKDEKPEPVAPYTPPPSPESVPDIIADAGVPVDAAPSKTLRTLVVGNSQIFFWDLPRLLSSLAASGPPESPRIAAEGFTDGGANLERLWQHGDSAGRNLAATIQNGKYDVVVIAESIDLVENPPPIARFTQYAKLLIDAARATGARPVLYATPYVDQKDHAGFVEMATPQIELGKAEAVTVAAGGLAWLRVWKELPSVFLHHTDYAHPGYKGSVISSMVVYSAITRETPIGLTTAPVTECGGPCPVITPDEGAVFQRAAWEEAQATSMR